jgi:hypothetical protein
MQSLQQYIHNDILIFRTFLGVKQALVGEGAMLCGLRVRLNGSFGFAKRPNTLLNPARFARWTPKATPWVPVSITLGNT